MARKLIIEVVGDTRDVERAMARSRASAKGLTGAMGPLERGIGRVAKTAGIAAGAAGLGAMFVTLRAGVKEFAQAQKVTAQTNAVIKSTGGVAGVTAKSVEALGREIMNYSGIDDEAVKSGQNLLLTFTNIRNSAGKNNDIFNQTTKAAADLSAALGKEMPAAALILGKALNDPATGLTRLQRIGVQFTEDQKKQIKALQESGKTMEAQKIILDGLNERFGGSAKAIGETIPGQLNKLREQFNNFAGDLVAKVVPTLVELGERLRTFLGREDVRRALQEISDLLTRGVAAGFELVRDAATVAASTIRTHWGTIQAVADAARKSVQNVKTFIEDVTDGIGGWKTALVVVGTAWATWRTTVIAHTIGVQIANIRAAAATATAWRAALLATGWGAFAVAAGAAAAYVITHWDQVKDFFFRFQRYITLLFKQLWADLREGAVRGVLHFLEPLSHIPTRAFQWARDAKKNLEGQLASINLEQTRISMERQGKMLGSTFAIAFAKAAAPAVQAAMAGVTGGPGSSGDRLPSQQGGPGQFASVAARHGGLQAGTAFLAAKVEAAGGFINAGRESGHSPTGGHGVGQSLDIAWAGNGPRIWAMLFPHRASFRLLLGPPGLYMWGARYYSAKDQGNHNDHIHVQYTGSADKLKQILGLGGSVKQMDLATEVAAAVAPAGGGGGSKGSAAAKAFEPIPVSFQVKLAEAELTTSDADNMRILKKMRKHLQDFLKSKKLSPEDRLSVLRELRSVNSSIESIEQRNADRLRALADKKRQAMLSAFRGLREKILREFDAITAAGLRQFDELTPAERELEGFREAREARRRSEQLADIQSRLASEDVETREQAARELREFQEDETERMLESRARAEREDRERQRRQYEEQRQEQRTALENWLDDQERALEEGRRSWEKFYADLRAIAAKYGFPLPDMSAPGSSPVAAAAAAASAAAGRVITDPRSAAGGHVLFDDGGTLAPGINVVENRTGRPERLVPAAKAMGAGGISVTVQGSVLTERQFILAVRDALTDRGRRNGGNLFRGFA